MRMVEDEFQRHAGELRAHRQDQPNPAEAAAEDAAQGDGNMLYVLVAIKASPHAHKF